MDSSFSISLSHTYFHLIHFSILRTPLSVSETYELSLFLGDALFYSIHLPENMLEAKYQLICIFFSIHLIPLVEDSSINNSLLSFSTNNKLPDAWKTLSYDDSNWSFTTPILPSSILYYRYSFGPYQTSFLHCLIQVLSKSSFLFFIDGKPAQSHGYPKAEHTYMYRTTHQFYSIGSLVHHSTPSTFLLSRHPPLLQFIFVLPSYTKKGIQLPSFRTNKMILCHQNLLSIQPMFYFHSLLIICRSMTALMSLSLHNSPMISPSTKTPSLLKVFLCLLIHWSTIQLHANTQKQKPNSISL